MFEKIEVTPPHFKNVSQSLIFPNGISAHEPFGHPLFAAHRTMAPGVAGLAGFALLFTACHFYFAAHVGLTNDEAYYRLWAMHPALSYFDHPPMLAVVEGCASE